MASEFLIWNKTSLLVIFILSIRLNTSTQSSYNNTSFVNLSLTSLFTKLARSRTFHTNAVDNMGPMIPSMKNTTTTTTMIVSNHRKIDTIVSSENLTKTLSSKMTLHNIANHSSVKMNEYAEQMNNKLIPIILKTNFTITNGHLIKNNANSNDFISSSISLFNNSKLNRSDTSSSVNKTSSTATKRQTNRSSMFTIWYRTISTRTVPKSFISLWKIGNVNNASRKSTVSSDMNLTFIEMLKNNDTLNTTLLLIDHTNIAHSDILQDKIDLQNILKDRFKGKKTTNLVRLLQIGLSSTTTKSSSSVVLSKIKKSNNQNDENSQDLSNRIKRDVLLDNLSTQEPTLVLQATNNTDSLNTTSTNVSFESLVDTSINTPVILSSNMIQIDSVSPILTIPSTTNMIDTSSSNLSNDITLEQLQTPLEDFSHSPNMGLQEVTTDLMADFIPTTMTSYNLLNETVSKYIIDEQETFSQTQLPMIFPSVTIQTLVETNTQSQMLNNTFNITTLEFFDSNNTSMILNSTQYEVSYVQNNTETYTLAPSTSFQTFPNETMLAMSDTTHDSSLSAHSISLELPHTTLETLPDISSIIISNNFTNETTSEIFYNTEQSFSIDSVSAIPLITQPSSATNQTSLELINSTLLYVSSESAVVNLLTITTNPTSLDITPSSTLSSDILNETALELMTNAEQTVLLDSTSTELRSSTTETKANTFNFNSSVNNLSNDSSLEPLSSTEENILLNSLSTELLNFTMDTMTHEVSPVIVFENYSMETSMELSNHTLLSFVTESVPMTIPTTIIQTKSDTQPIITLSDDVTNASTIIPMNDTPENSIPNLVSEKLLTTELNTFTHTAINLNTQLSNLNNETSPELLNNTDESATTISLPVEIFSTTMGIVDENYSYITQSSNILVDTSSVALNDTTTSVSVQPATIELESTTIEKIPITSSTDTSSITFENSSNTELFLSSSSLSTQIPSVNIKETVVTTESLSLTSSITNVTELDMINNTQEFLPSVSLPIELTSMSVNITSNTESINMWSDISTITLTQLTDTTAKSLVERSSSIESPYDTINVTTTTELVGTLSESFPFEILTVVFNTTEGFSPLNSMPTISSTTLMESTYGNQPIETTLITVSNKITPELNNNTPVTSMDSESTILTVNTIDITHITPLMNTEPSHTSEQSILELASSTETISLTNSIPAALITSTMPIANVTEQLTEGTSSIWNQSTSELVNVIENITETMNATLTTISNQNIASEILNSTTGFLEVSSIVNVSLNSTMSDIYVSETIYQGSSSTLDQSTSMLFNNTREISLDSIPTTIAVQTIPITQMTQSMYTESSNITLSSSTSESLSSVNSLAITSLIPSTSITDTTGSLNTVSNIIFNGSTREYMTNRQEITSTNWLSIDSISTNTYTPVDTQSVTMASTNVISETSTKSINSTENVLDFTSISTNLPTGTMESLTTSSITELQEHISSNQNLNQWTSSTLAILSSPLVSQTQVSSASSENTEWIGSSISSTASSLIINSTSTSILITESTIFADSLFNSSPSLSSTLTSSLSSMYNIYSGPNNENSTSGTSLNTMNTISSSKPTSESFATTVTVMESMSLITNPTMTSSILSSSIISSTLVNTNSRNFTTTQIENRTDTTSSEISLNSINTETTTTYTILLSTLLKGETNTLATTSSSLRTEITTTISSSLSTMIIVPSTSSSSTIQITTNTINPAVSNENTLSSTFMFSMESSMINRFEPSTTIQETSSSHSSSSFSQSDTTNQATFTTKTNGITLLSSLLTTSSVFISNDTSTIQNMISSIPFTSQSHANTTLVMSTNDCVFPFRYLGQWFGRCISDILNNSWCSLTDDFDRDRKWKYCQASRVKTIGGTGNGSDCVFPFVYQGTAFSTCIYRTVVTGTARSFSLFCSTTSNLDQDGLWGYCLDYESCYFPFVYNGIAYSDCISGLQSARWCSTTARTASFFSFDRNKMWSNCPVTCDGYPQQDINSVGFRLIPAERSCIYKKSIARDTGLTLKYYALPTCQLEPLCRNNYVPLFKQITCKEDGRYDYPITICLPTR